MYITFQKVDSHFGAFKRAQARKCATP